MLPKQQQFRDHMKQLDIKKSDQVVFYTNEGNMLASRGYWMLKTFRHPNVMILNGGLKKWKGEGRQLQTSEIKEEEYEYKFNITQYKAFEDINEIVKNLDNNENYIEFLDARF